VAQEDERNVAIAPVVAEAVRVRVGILQRDVRQGSEIHSLSVDPFDGASHAIDARSAEASPGYSNNTFTAPDFP
jgi:hypothetical protein